MLYTSASDYQLGAVITQDGGTLAFYSIKLDSARKNYAVTKKELLSIVETLSKFRGILYTDHKNLDQINSTASSQRAMHLRILMEEFGSKIVYIKRIGNAIAGALSRINKKGETPCYDETNQNICPSMRLFTSK